MAKQFASVADDSSLSGLPVSEYDEGALAFNFATTTYYTLRHNVPFNAPIVSGSVRPQDGNPSAGSPFAVWEKWNTKEPGP